MITIGEGKGGGDSKRENHILVGPYFSEVQGPTDPLLWPGQRRMLQRLPTRTT